MLRVNSIKRIKVSASVGRPHGCDLFKLEPGQYSYFRPSRRCSVSSNAVNMLCSAFPRFRSIARYGNKINFIAYFCVLIIEYTKAYEDFSAFLLYSTIFESLFIQNYI